MRTKKKMAMMVAMAAVVLVALVGSGPVLAQQVLWGVIQCDSNPCYATGGKQMLFEQVGDGVADDIYAQDGHDNIRAQNYTNDNDTANGGTGNDVLHVNDGDALDDADTANGGTGNDVLHVNDGDALDDARGGSGYDTCVVDAAVEATNSCEMVVYR